MKLYGSPDVCEIVDMKRADGNPESPRPRRVTATDVAEAAGVSRSAVSRAFTDGAYLDQVKKTRILKVSQELGYRPNAFAAGLQTTHSNIVAVVAGEMRSHFDQQLVDHLLKELVAIGKWPIVLSGPEISEAPNLHGIFGFPVDAMIVRGGSVDKFVVESCAKLQIPLILSGCVVDAGNVDSVCCKNFEGMYALARLLVETGRKRIAYIDGLPNRTSTHERPAGAKAGLAESGLSLVDIETANFSYEGGYRAALALMKKHDLDAIMCANDEAALGAITAVKQELGLDVPQDVAITGFDGLRMSEWPNFRLTTARNPVDKTVAAIVRLLSERLKNPNKPGETVLIEPEIMERETH